MTAPAVAAIPVVGAPVLAVSWWCSASPRNWTWTPAPYVGAWVILAAVAGLAIWWRVRGRHTEPEPDAREAEALEVGSGPYPASPAVLVLHPVAKPTRCTTSTRSWGGQAVATDQSTLGMSRYRRSSS